MTHKFALAALAAASVALAAPLAAPRASAQDLGLDTGLGLGAGDTGLGLGNDRRDRAVYGDGGLLRKPDSLLGQGRLDDPLAPRNPIADDPLDSTLIMGDRPAEALGARGPLGDPAGPLVVDGPALAPEGVFTGGDEPSSLLGDRIEPILGGGGEIFGDPSADEPLSSGDSEGRLQE